MHTAKDKLHTVLVTDCGSTTTKALLFQQTAEGWRHTCRGEAPTTVEEPVADVTVGALNAFNEVQEVSGRRILRPAGEGGAHPFLETGSDPTQGINLYLSTSSAGGGLQMMVAGVVGQMTTESASRAALGAGAIVMDAISADDGREDHERIERIRHLRPDIVLLTGGVDAGSRNHAVEMAEILVAAAPRPRFGDTLKLPVIFAGNREVAEDVYRILSKTADARVVENVRPTLEEENLGPARDAIHELFLTHVMSHSPGYGKLLSWTPVPIMPTPAAVGDMVRSYAQNTGSQVLCVDIGGATTDVFSVFRNIEGAPIFNRTVSANYGMSYSVANVLIEAGAQAIMRWLPYEISESELRDQLRNKMIRPTSIPQTIEDLWLEQAVCREALRLSLVHHRSLAVGLSGVQQRRGIADIFSQRASRYELVDMLKLDVVIGSGGVLSHAPHRLGAALMMMDGFGIAGITRLTVDSVFMLPHLGVFAGVHPAAAQQIFERDCIVHIADAVAPVWSGRMGASAELCAVLVDGRQLWTLHRGEVQAVALEPGREVSLRVEPRSGRVDIGQGPGVPVEKRIRTGLHGLVLDGRNRPIELPPAGAERAQAQKKVFAALGLV